MTKLCAKCRNIKLLLGSLFQASEKANLREGGKLKTSIVASSLTVCALLAACAQATMDIMSRSEGKVYHGMIQKTGEGQGTVTMNIAGVEYTGRYSRTSSEQYTSFVGTYARNNEGGAAGAVGSGTTFGSKITLMAILSSAQGDGMRCAMQGDRMSGTGGGSMCG